MSREKIIPPQSIEALITRLHSEGAIIVFTNGVFDLLHPGHIAYLSEARKLGTHLLVALNSDASTARIKGEMRPLMALEARLEILAALEAVSFVTWFDEDTPVQIIHMSRPDVLVKGGDWKLHEIVGRDFVESYGGKVLTIPFLPGYSTTSIVEKIVKL